MQYGYVLIISQSTRKWKRSEMSAWKQMSRSHLTSVSRADQSLVYIIRNYIGQGYCHLFSISLIAFHFFFLNVNENRYILHPRDASHLSYLYTSSTCDLSCPEYSFPQTAQKRPSYLSPDIIQCSNAYPLLLLRWDIVSSSVPPHPKYHWLSTQCPGSVNSIWFQSLVSVSINLFPRHSRKGRRWHGYSSASANWRYSKRFVVVLFFYTTQHTYYKRLSLTDRTRRMVVTALEPDSREHPGCHWSSHTTWYWRVVRRHWDLGTPSLEWKDVAKELCLDSYIRYEPCTCVQFSATFSSRLEFSLSYPQPNQLTLPLPISRAGKRYSLSKCLVFNHIERQSHRALGTERRAWRLHITSRNARKMRPVSFASNISTLKLLMPDGSMRVTKDVWLIPFYLLSKPIYDQRGRDDKMRRYEKSRNPRLRGRTARVRRAIPFTASKSAQSSLLYIQNSNSK